MVTLTATLFVNRFVDQILQANALNKCTFINNNYAIIIVVDIVQNLQRSVGTSQNYKYKGVCSVVYSMWMHKSKARFGVCLINFKYNFII